MNKINCKLCYHYWHEEEMDSISSCNCCEHGDLFTPVDLMHTFVCPYCGSPNFECVDDWDGENTITRICVCDKCDKTFHLNFGFSGYSAG